MKESGFFKSRGVRATLSILFLSLVLLMIITEIALLSKNREQESKFTTLQGELEARQAELNALTAQLEALTDLLTNKSAAEIEALNEQITDLRNELQGSKATANDLRNDLARANDEALQAEAERWNLEYQLFSLTEYLTANGGTLDINDDKRASTVFLPKGAITLIDTFARAISTGDEALYLSILRPMEGDDVDVSDHNEYMLGQFERLKNTAYTVTGLEPHIFAVDRLQGGGYYMTVTMVDENGNSVMIPAVGVTKYYMTGKWLIYDFD